MRNIVHLYVKTEFKKKWLSLLRQLLFLVPIMSLILVMSSSENIKYINQREFLNAASYSSISMDHDRGTNTFEVYEGNIAVVENIRGAAVYRKQYACEIYNIIENHSYEFEKTYFCDKNIDKDMLNSLQKDEIIISYDTAKRLKVSIGDEVAFYSDKNENIETFVVVGIMKTKYPYKKIGNAGTVITKTNKNRFTRLYENLKLYSFLDNQEGEIHKQDELTECNYLLLSISSTIVINVIFPLAGILLVVIILNKEINRLYENVFYNYAVLVSLGMERKKIGDILLQIEGIVLTAGSILTMVLYKYVIMQGLIGKYISWRTFMIYLILLVLTSIILMYVNIKRMYKKMQNIDLVEGLKRKRG